MRDLTPHSSDLIFDVSVNVIRTPLVALAKPAAPVDRGDGNNRAPMMHALTVAKLTRYATLGSHAYGQGFFLVSALTRLATKGKSCDSSSVVAASYKGDEITIVAPIH